MSEDVQFEEDNERFQSRKIFGRPATPKIVLALMHYFHIEKERTAGNIIIITLAVLLVLSGFIIYKTAIPRAPGKAEINQNLPEKVKAALPKT